MSLQHPGVYQVTVTDITECTVDRYVDVAAALCLTWGSHPTHAIVAISCRIEDLTSNQWTHQWTQVSPGPTPLGTGSAHFHDLTANGPGNFTFEVTTSDISTGCSATDQYSISVLDTCINVTNGCNALTDLDPTAQVDCDMVTMDDGVAPIWAPVQRGPNYGTAPSPVAPTPTMRPGATSLASPPQSTPYFPSVRSKTRWHSAGRQLHLRRDRHGYLRTCPLTSNPTTMPRLGIGISGQHNTGPSRHTYLSGGTYTVTLVVTAGGINCTATVFEPSRLGRSGSRPRSSRPALRRGATALVTAANAI